MALRLSRPSLIHEQEMLRAGARHVAGVDEVGRGALAGPVAAAAVVLPNEAKDWFDQVNDSKVLTAKVREKLSKAILADASVGLAMVSSRRIDAEGIVPATKRAMAQAVRALGPGVDGLLVDALDLPEVGIERQLAIVHGDQISISIASASIVAKVARDQLMRALDREYGGYHLSRNKGYGTEAHRDAIIRLGPSTIHRMTFLSNVLRDSRIDRKGNAQ